MRRIFLDDKNEGTEQATLVLDAHLTPTGPGLS
jgi:hypothetical protein